MLSLGKNPEKTRILNILDKGFVMITKYIENLG